MTLCACPSPLRDATSPERRFRCVRCGGETPAGRHLNLDDTRHLVRTTISRLERLIVDLTHAYEAAYGLHSATGGTGRRTGHSDPTSQAVATRGVVAGWWQVSAGKLLRAAAWVERADDAAGFALLAADPHRGPDDHAGRWYDKPITVDTPPGEISDSRDDLREAQASLVERRARGEL